MRAAECLTYVQTKADQFEAFLNKPQMMKLLRALEIASFIGLAVLAAYLSPKSFFPAAAGGLLVGAFMHRNDYKKVHHHHAHGHAHEHEQHGCADDYAKLGGVKVPGLIRLALMVIAIYCHVDHHTKWIAPCTGIVAGMFLGKLLVTKVPSLYQRASHICSKQPKILTAS